MTDPKALLAIRRFRVVELKWESADTFTLVLTPEQAAEMGSFKAGQWVYLHILDKDGTSKGRAAFSMASAPEESAEKVEFGIKVAGGFTKAMADAMPDDVVGVQGPFGVFVLPETTDRLTVFAGGVGVTPFRSMIRSAWLRKMPKEIVLFYSNRFVDDAAYLDELEKIAKEYPSLRLVFTLTGDDTPAVWKGEVGRVNEEMVKKYITDFSTGDFLMCGPVGFMETIRTILTAQGVDVKKRLRQELFG